MKRIAAFILFSLVGSLFAHFTDDFNGGETVNWTPKTAARWTAGFEYGRYAFFINTGEYDNEPGSKLGEYALVNDRTWSDFSFSCLARSREDFSANPVADFCIVFGYQDNSNYYYMLFNRWNGYSQLFKIVSDTRTEIATADFWIYDNEYHIVEIQRSGGMIAVQYDGNPVLTAYDAAFGAGGIGLGSYNDAASFDDVRIEDEPLSYDRAIRMTPVVSSFVLDEPAGLKSNPAIDVTPDGSFVLAWQYVRDKEFWSMWYAVYAVYARVFSQQGIPLTPAIHVNTGFYGISPAIAASNDRFVVSWTDFPFSFPFLDDSRGIAAKEFTLDGSLLSSGMLCWSDGSMWDIITDRSTSDVVYPGTGDFAAVWSERVFMANNYDVHGNWTGNVINDSTDSDQDHPSIAADSQGRFLAAWDHQSSAVYAQAFAPGGSRVGSNFQVNQTQTGDGMWNTLSANADGDAVISWTMDGAVYARRATTSGALVGNEVPISEGGVSDVSINRRGEACAVLETETSGASDIRVHFMQEDGTWSAASFNINGFGGFWHSPRAVLWENCLYSVYENSEDTSVVSAVHLLGNWPPNYSPTFTGAISDTAVEDTPYEYMPQASDPNGNDVSFSFFAFPAWLVPAGNAIAGTPLQSDGDTSFVVVASDGVSSDSFEVHLTIIPVNDPPQIISPDSVTAYTDSLFMYTATAVDDEDSVLTYTYLDYPSWLELSDTFVPGNPPFIFGIVPRDAQDTTFTVVASDGELTDTLCVHIQIVSINAPPRVVNLSDFEFQNTESYPILLDTCVVDDDPVALLTWTILPGTDLLTVSIQERVALLSAPGWIGTTPVLFLVTDPDGASDSLTVMVTVGTNSVPRDGEIHPKNYCLQPAYPNPFNATTVISYELPVTAECAFAVYNLKGELLRELFRGRKEAGFYTLVWDGNGFSSGTYLIRMKANGFVRTQKCTLVK